MVPEQEAFREEAEEQKNEEMIEGDDRRDIDVILTDMHVFFRIVILPHGRHDHSANN